VDAPVHAYKTGGEAGAVQVPIDAMLGAMAFNKGREGARGPIRIEGGKVAGHNMYQPGVGLYVFLGFVQGGFKPLGFALNHLGQVGHSGYAGHSFALGVQGMGMGVHSAGGFSEVPEARAGNDIGPAAHGAVVYTPYNGGEGLEEGLQFACRVRPPIVVVAPQQNFFAGPCMQPSEVLRCFSGFEGPGNVAGDDDAIFGGDGRVPALREGIGVAEPAEAFHVFLACRGQV